MTRFLSYVFSFAFFKSCVFFAPLLLAALMSPEQYGQFEFSISLAQLIAVILNMGIPAAVPYFLIKLKRPYLRYFYLYALVVSIFILVFSLSVILLEASSRNAVISLLAGIFAVQFIMSAVKRTNSSGAKASFHESSVYLFIVCVAGGALIVPYTMDTNFLVNTLLVLNIMQIVYCLGKFVSLTDRNRSLAVCDLKNILGYSLPIVPGAFVLIFLTTFGKTSVGFFLGDDVSANYNIFFRYSSIAVIIYQMLHIYFFARLYTANEKQLDNMLSGILSVVVIFSFTVLIFLSQLDISFIELWSRSFQKYGCVAVLLCFYMGFWVSLSQLEMVLYRENIKKKFIVTLFVTSFFALLGVWLLYVFDVLSLERIVAIHIVAMIGTLIPFYIYLSKVGVRLVKHACLVFLLSIGANIVLLIYHSVFFN